MKCKQKLSLVIAILILLVSNNEIVFAINDIDEFSKTALEQNTVSVLQELAQSATNESEATAVYEELVKRVANSQIKASAVIDTYLTHYSTSINGTSIDIYYRVKALIPSGASLSVGYEYPAYTRTSGSSFSLNGKPAGTYHAYFVSKGLRCYSRTYAALSAYSYSEKKVYSTYLAFNTAGRHTHHTVTSADATANKVALTAAGIFTTLSFPKGSAAYWTSLIVSGLSITAVWSTSPGLSAGQYIQLYTYYSGGRMYQRIKVWHNYTAFKNDYSNPMYNNLSSTALPRF